METSDKQLIVFIPPLCPVSLDKYAHTRYLAGLMGICRKLDETTHARADALLFAEEHDHSSLETARQLADFLVGNNSNRCVNIIMDDGNFCGEPAKDYFRKQEFDYALWLVIGRWAYMERFFGAMPVHISDENIQEAKLALGNNDDKIYSVLVSRISLFATLRKKRPRLAAVK